MAKKPSDLRALYKPTTRETARLRAKLRELMAQTHKAARIADDNTERCNTLEMDLKDIDAKARERQNTPMPG